MNSSNDSGEEKKRTKNGQDLDKVISRRNRRLSSLFNEMGLPVRIIGDPNSPAVIVNNKFVLNAYVHNFELRFMDNHIGGNCIYTIKLLAKPEYDKEKVLDCIYKYPVRYISKIVLEDTNYPLRVVGRDYLDKNDGTGEYYVFGTASERFWLYDDVVNESVLKKSNAPVYLVGYNYLNREESLGRYPVFANHNPKVYFEKEKAEDALQDLKKEGYNCKVITEK